MSHKKTLLNKLMQTGSATLLSKLLGFVREIFFIKYLGVSATADAFWTAYQLPGSLRKIFSEGALSASLVPTLVDTMRTQQKKVVHSLMLLALILFEGIILLACFFAFWKAGAIIHFLRPGFGPERIELTEPLFKILLPLILFVSSSAIISSALQSVNHFIIPALGPAIINIAFIGSAMLCLNRALPVCYFCCFVLIGGLVQLVIHLIAYFRFNFSFARIDRQTWLCFKPVTAKFLFCSLSVGISELSLIIDSMFASYLPAGSVALMSYSSRFMGIPLGIFASSLSIILLPHLSRMSRYAPKRLSFYLLESAKMVLWITLPATILMIFFSEKIFHTLFLSENFTALHVIKAQAILTAFSLGMFALALNKILHNIFYAMHITWIPACIVIAGTALNAGLNFLWLTSLQTTGLALATTISACLQTCLLIYVLRAHFNFTLYLKNYWTFARNYTIQLATLLIPFFCVYFLCIQAMHLLPESTTHFFLYNIGFWVWVSPLVGCTALLTFLTRARFGVKLYFID